MSDQTVDILVEIAEAQKHPHRARVRELEAEIAALKAQARENFDLAQEAWCAKEGMRLCSELVLGVWEIIGDPLNGENLLEKVSELSARVRELEAEIATRDARIADMQKGNERLNRIIETQGARVRELEQLSATLEERWLHARNEWSKFEYAAEDLSARVRELEAALGQERARKASSDG